MTSAWVFPRGFVFAAAILLAKAAAGWGCPPEFRRGDADANGRWEITDPVFTLGYLFLFGLPEESLCLDALDATDDGTIDLTDAIYALNFLFLGGPQPSEPYGECGPDPTEDALDCREFVPCGTHTLEDWDEIRSRFGTLETIAGNGAFDKDVNGWRPEYEGGPATAADLSAPHTAAADGENAIYIADKEAHAVRKVTPDGRIFTVAGVNEPGDDGDEPGPGRERHLRDPNGLWVRADGTVYILDLGNAKVRRLSPDGTLSTLFVLPGLLVGRGLWVSDSEDLAYVASGDRIVRWSPSGGLEVFASGFVQLGNIAVDRDGTVIATDRSLHRVYRIAADGTAEPIAGNGRTSGGGDGQPALETALYEVRGVAIAWTGGLFLATHRGSQVWYLDTKGTIHLFLDGAPTDVHAGDGEHWSTPGKKVSEIRNVTFDARGNLLVTENDYGYVRRVEYLPPPPCP